MIPNDPASVTELSEPVEARRGVGMFRTGKRLRARTTGVMEIIRMKPTYETLENGIILLIISFISIVIHVAICIILKIESPPTSEIWIMFCGLILIINYVIFRER